MPKKAWMLLVAIALAACTNPFTRDESDKSLKTAATPIVSTTATSPPTGPIRGALPDGTIYDIAFPNPRSATIVDIEAPISIEVDGTDIPIEIAFRPSRGPNSEADVVLRVGAWTLGVTVPDTVGDQSLDLIESSMELTTEVEMPVITLQAPLGWSGKPQVEYETFLVRSGCAVGAAVCNSTHAVSVLPHQGTSLDPPISLQSYSLRPESDPNRLPPGPLHARWSPDVMWTGREMIVWGGGSNPGPPDLVDGASFDPVTDDWDLIPKPPLRSDQATRAVWTGAEMVVIGEEATVGWNPASRQWRRVADGVVAPLDPGMSLAWNSRLVTWNNSGIHVLRAEHGWETMPDPGVGEPGLLGGSVLRVAGTGLVAIGEEGCDRLVSSWTGDNWTEPVRISLGATPSRCGQANQTVVHDESLVLWDDTSGAVVSYDPSSGSVDDLPTFPLPATEHAPGPLQLDNSFLATAGLEGAIFDHQTARWRTVVLPGLGTDVDMVWTGDEVLMWDKCCYGPEDIDAWRWSPPLS